MSTLRIAHSSCNPCVAPADPLPQRTNIWQLRKIPPFHQFSVVEQRVCKELGLSELWQRTRSRARLRWRRNAEHYMRWKRIPREETLWVPVIYEFREVWVQQSPREVQLAIQFPRALRG